MFLRFSQILLIYFLLFSYVESAESGGMPQLNPEFLVFTNLLVNNFFWNNVYIIIKIYFTKNK